MSEKRDYRALDHRTLEFLRTRAVECLVEEGETPNDVAHILGVPVQDVYKWRKMYERGGWEELKAKPIPGRPRADAASMDVSLGAVDTSNHGTLDYLSL